MALMVPGKALLEGSIVWKMAVEKTWLCTGKEAYASKLGQRLSLDPKMPKEGPAQLSSTEGFAWC